MIELYNENFKPAKTEVKTGTIKWQTIPCQSISRVNIVRTIISPKAIYGFNEFLIKIPIQLLTEIEKPHKFHMESQKAPDNQNNQ